MLSFYYYYVLLISILEETIKTFFQIAILVAIIGMILLLALITLYALRHEIFGRKYDEERRRIIEAEETPASTDSKKD